MLRTAFALMLTLAACAQDETLSGYAGVGSTWQLTSLDGDAWAHPGTLEFPEAGQITGQAPCNRYFASVDAPYPWLTLGPIGATRMACPDLAAETQFFEALSAMTIAEVTGDVLILTNDAGREMVFDRIAAP